MLGVLGKCSDQKPERERRERSGESSLTFSSARSYIQVFNFAKKHAQAERIRLRNIHLCQFVWFSSSIDRSKNIQ